MSLEREISPSNFFCVGQFEPLIFVLFIFSLAETTPPPKWFGSDHIYIPSLLLPSWDETNKSCRLAPLCHLPQNELFLSVHFLKSRGKEQLEFHKTARELGLQSWLQRVLSYLSALAECQQELFQAPSLLQNAPQLGVWKIFCGW